MKKILSTLAIAGVATLALASCNGDKPTPTDKPAEEAYSGQFGALLPMVFLHYSRRRVKLG